MRKLSFLIVMLALVFGGLLVWWQSGLAPANPADKTQKMFVIQQGKGVREIANELKDAGLIKDPIVFFLMVKENRWDNKIQAGEFYLSPSMSAQQVAKALQVGTFDTRITIPEGKRADEIADILQQHFSSYSEDWRPQLEAHEGYLFPDTYAFRKDVDLNTVITTMKNNFEKKYDSISGTRKNTLSKAEIVNISSLVEREARFPEDRPLVASVILNRLKIGMALQLDATVQYALGYQPAEKNWWKKNLTLADINLVSPYNTYANPGLPPTPISNPGFDVLNAVVNAPDTDYLYYITDPKTGRNVYSKTLAEHNANIKKYGLQ